MITSSPRKSKRNVIKQDPLAVVARSSVLIQIKAIDINRFSCAKPVSHLYVLEKKLTPLKLNPQMFEAEQAQCLIGILHIALSICVAVIVWKAGNENRS